MHPILLKIGPLELYTYGAFLALAFLAAIFLAGRMAERDGINPQFIADLGIVVILSSVVGSRIFFILFYDLQHTLENPSELLRIRQTGLVFYGGLIGAAAAGLIYTRLKRVPVLLLMDIAAPSLAIGQAIGRIGCLMSGCCFGAKTDVPWAIRLPYPDYACHPAQIYESVATFGLFLFLMWFRKRKTADGQVAWLYLVIYAAARFIIEFFRGDNPHILMGLTISQVISVAGLFLAALYFMWGSASKKRMRPAPPVKGPTGKQS